MWVTAIIAVLQVVLQMFGINIGKDGVNINWKRLLLWSLLAPVVALVAGRIVAVFGDCVTMFRIWSGESGNFALGFFPRTLQTLLPPPSGNSAGIAPYANFFFSVFLWFGLDRIIALSLQVLAIRIFLKNFDRICSAITATVHTAVAVMSK